MKVTKRFIKGKLSKNEILNEAKALAKLSESDNNYVVRYHNAWIEKS